MATETIELKDNVSGPAKAATAAVMGLDRAIEAVRKHGQALTGIDKAIAKIGEAAARANGPLKAIDEQLKNMRKEASRPIDVQVRASGGGGGSGGGLAGIFGGGAGALAGLAVVEKVFGLVERVGAEVYDLTKSGALLAIQMSNWQTSTRALFTNLTGSSAAADELIGKAEAISRLTGESTESVADRMKKLIADGFSAKAAEKILTAVADVTAMRGDVAGDKLQKAIETVKNKDIASAGDLKKLAGAGVDQGDVYAELARRTHRSMDQVRADLKAGRIEGDLAAAAIASAAEKRYGGAAKSKADNDIWIQLARVEGGFKKLFKGVDISPVLGALQNVDTMLQGAGGKMLKGSISGVFGQLFHTLFDPFNGPGGQQKLELFAKGASEGLDKLTGLLKQAAPYVSFFVDCVAALGKGDKNGVTGLDKMLKTAERIYEIFKLLSGFSTNPIESIQKIFGSAEATPKGGGASKGKSSIFDGLLDPLGIGKMMGVANPLGAMGVDGASAANDAAPQFAGAGDAMIDGLVGAVTGGRSAVVNACRDTARAGADAARAELGIASPSKVFAEIGMYAMQGMAQGMSANDRVASASAGAASQSARAASMGASGGGASSGGGTFAPTIHFAPVVHANDKAGGEAASAALMSGPLDNALRDGLTRAWREWRESA